MKVRKLILFHHDPSRSDTEVAAIKGLCNGLAAKANSSILVEAAKEDSEVVL